MSTFKTALILLKKRIFATYFKACSERVCLLMYIYCYFHNNLDGTNGLLYADVPLRNYSLTHRKDCPMMYAGAGATFWCRVVCDVALDPRQQDVAPPTSQYTLCGAHWQLGAAAET